MQIDADPLPSVVGGKAYQLYRLRALCDVPPFFTLTFDDPQEIREPTIQQRILDHCRSNNLDLMAVRSSATIEDSSNASFAGMFETVLNVRPPDLISAITKVLDSVKGKRVTSYSRAHGLAYTDIRMNVIIQKMVSSRVSGVCFTRTLEQRDSLLIEACLGLGEALVSGTVTPDSYQVSRKVLATEKVSIGYQRVMLRSQPTQTEEPHYQEVPFHKRNARKLTDEEIGQIATTSLAIEEQLGFDAADVEWAFEGEVLYILQARPYTGFKLNAT